MTVAKQKKETFFQRIARNWKTNPMFSTGCVLVLMIIVQTIALGFNDASFGAWLQRWGKNWINILRNNAGVGIVALGMTFVIISGGIDLSVGSTLVAVGAMVMMVVDGSATGLLAAPILSRLVDEARETWHNLLVEVVPIKNRFFGETITVAGLLTGRDLMEQLRGREADILLLPRDMLRREGDCFLDDATPDEVAQALSMRVEMLPVDGADLLEALFW